MVRTKRVVVALAVVALGASCQKFAEGRQMFRDLLVLRDQLAKQFHEKAIDISVSPNGGLTVKFINSPLQSTSGDVKQKRADDVAAFVMSHYNHPVSSVATQFVSARGPARVTETFIGRAAKP